MLRGAAGLAQSEGARIFKPLRYARVTACKRQARRDFLPRLEHVPSLQRLPGTAPESGEALSKPGGVAMGLGFP